MADKKDFIAIIFFATGSSYARGPDLDDCVNRVAKIFASDWGSMFDVAGKEVTVGCYEVTGHDNLYWDNRGVFTTVENEETEVPLLETRKVTLPKKKGK